MAIDKTSGVKTNVNDVFVSLNNTNDIKASLMLYGKAMRIR